MMINNSNGKNHGTDKKLNRKKILLIQICS